MSTEVTLESRIPGGYGGTLTPVRTEQAGRELARKRWDTAERL